VRRSRPRLPRFEIRPLSGKGTTPPAASRVPFARALPTALLAALALAIAGCGGGGPDPESEDAARQQIEAAAAKLEAAPSLTVSLVAEGEEDGAEPEKVGCVEIDADKRKPERIDLRVDLSCSGGPETPEMIAVGRRAWTTTTPGSWTAAEISPSVLSELGDEQTDFAQLLDDAHDIEQISADDAVEERAAGGGAKTEYRFEAPASSFGDVSDLGVDDVDFEATVDAEGVLEEVSIHASQDGAGARIVETYRNVGDDVGIEPPPSSEVHGSINRISSQEELDALLGASF
jgi:hypothetical protein